MRKVKFKVMFYNSWNDRLITLFTTDTYEAAEHFAIHFEGEGNDLFIQKAWALETRTITGGREP